MIVRRMQFLQATLFAGIFSLSANLLANDAQRFDTIEKGLEELINRLNQLDPGGLHFPSPPPDPIPVGEDPHEGKPIPVASPIEAETAYSPRPNPVRKPSLSSARDDVKRPQAESVDEFESEPLGPALNKFNLYFAYCVPNECSLGNKEVQFKSGSEFGLEYQREFLDQSYLGLSWGMKSFDTTGTAGGYELTGSNSLMRFDFTLGQEWEFTDTLSILTQGSIGIATSSYEVKVPDLSYTLYDSSATSFHYAILLGLKLEWNDSWHSALFYEFDGRSESNLMDYQSFHQFGIETGLSF